MNRNSLLKKAQREAEVFFEKMGFPADVRAELDEESSVLIYVRLEDPQVLIGRKGETLIMVQRLLSRVIRRKIDYDLRIDLDINEYKKRKMGFLKELAQVTADEVALNKKEKELEPMPAYERRIIHLALAERKDVSTESRGEEPYRRLVIKPS